MKNKNIFYIEIGTGALIVPLDDTKNVEYLCLGSWKRRSIKDNENNNNQM